MAQVHPQARVVAARRIWRPVKQQAADSFLMVFIVSFGITVILVRVFLELSGYPQVGDQTFHIAHLLWGGLLLIVALLILLLWANRWLLWVVALLGGIGAGLFIDEIGKFITQSNDYFFPLAFPIIYASLILCVWLYVRVRRTRPRDTRTLLYHALDDLKQVLDNDLDPFEHTLLQNELTQVIKNADDSNEQKLARALFEFVRARDLRLAREPNPLEQGLLWLRFIAARWPSRRVFIIVLVLGFGLIGAQALFKLGVLVTAAFGGTLALEALFGKFVIVSGKSEYIVNHPTLLLVWTVAIIGVGLCALAAALLLVTGRERLGVRVGTLALAFSLTVVNLLTFYFSQVYAIAEALGQALLLGVAAIYRWRFFLNK